MKWVSLVQTSVLGLGFFAASAFGDIPQPTKTILVSKPEQCSELYKVLNVRETRLASGSVSKTFASTDKGLTISCERNPKDADDCTCTVTQKIDFSAN